MTTQRTKGPDRPAARPATKSTAEVREEQGDAIERARAAHWLLDSLHVGGELALIEKPHAYWLTRMALRELDEALQELRRLAAA